MIEELWLDGKLVDLPPRKVSQTYQINDLAEVRDRQLNYTNRFLIGFTPVNIVVMDYLGVIGNNSDKPYRKIPARYVVNGIELMPSGYAVVRKANKGYEVNIYDGNADLYEILKGRRLNQLNFQDLNHTLNTTLYANSVDNTSGYVYGLGHFGFSNYASIVNIERQAPSLYVHTLIDKIITGAGKTYSGDVFQNAEFLREVVPPTLGYTIDGSGEVETDLGSIQSGLVSRSESSSDPVFFSDKYSISSSGGILQSSISNNGIDVNFTGTLKLDIQLTHTLTQGYASFSIEKNGNAIAGTGLTNGTGINQNLSYSIYVEAGDRIEFMLNTSSFEPSDPELTLYQIEASSSFDCDLAEVTGGIFIDFNAIMPDSSQIDFLKDFMQRYGVMFQTTTRKDHYEFFTMETLLNDRDNAEDWSDKLSTIGGEEYKVGNYAQNNLMKYNYEKDVVETLLDGNLTVDNDNLSDEITLFNSIFTISERIGAKNTNDIYTIPIWEEVDEDGVMVVNNLESELRIFKILRDNSTINVQQTGVSGSVPVTGDIPYLSLENVAFSFYIANNYPAFNRVLDKQLKRTPRVLLSPLDIYRLDFSRLKFFEQFGQYFYLNKLSNFIPGKSVVAEIIQARGITVNQPPSQLGVKNISVTHGTTKALMLSDFTNTTPPYADPEFDQPENIRLLSGFDTEILITLNGIAITTQTDIPVADVPNLRIEDQGNDANAHNADILFTIQSFNSSNFSSEVGTLSITVAQENNVAPIAEAGTNRTLVYDSSSEPDGVTDLFGCASYDPNGHALTYLWTLEGTIPPEISLTNDNLCQGTINGTGLTAIHDGVSFTARLRVTDPFSLFDEDTCTVTLLDLNPNPA